MVRILCKSVTILTTSLSYEGWLGLATEQLFTYPNYYVFPDVRFASKLHHSSSYRSRCIPIAIYFINLVGGNTTRYNTEHRDAHPRTIPSASQATPRQQEIERFNPTSLLVRSPNNVNLARVVVSNSERLGKNRRLLSGFYMQY